VQAGVLGCGSGSEGWRAGGRKGGGCTSFWRFDPCEHPPERKIPWECTKRTLGNPCERGYRDDLPGSRPVYGLLGLLARTPARARGAFVGRWAARGALSEDHARDSPVLLPRPPGRMAEGLLVTSPPPRAHSWGFLLETPIFGFSVQIYFVFCQRYAQNTGSD